MQIDAARFQKDVICVCVCVCVCKYGKHLLNMTLSLSK